MWKGGLFVVLLVVVLHGCSDRPATPPAISLVGQFSEAKVTGSPDIKLDFPPIEWRFDGASSITPEDDESASVGWSAFNEIEDLGVRDGLLQGTVVGAFPILMVAIPENAFPEDRLWAVEIKLRISAGTTLGIDTFRSKEIELDELLRGFRVYETSEYMVKLRPGTETVTYTLTEANSIYSKTGAIGGLKHLTLRFIDAEGADFALESFRIIPRTEHLAGMPAGIGWHALAGVFRETLVARTPERLTWQQDLGERPWLDLAVGTPDNHPVVFTVEASSPGMDSIVRAHTVTAGSRWEPFAVDLEALAGRKATLELSLSSDEDGHIGFWGAPAIRHRGARPAVTEPTAARAALGDIEAPQGVILIVADTLRSDHLDAWGYERRTAPTVTALAAQGTRFADTISQGSWTKVSFPSLVTSLYASSHGVYDIPHTIPASVTTLTEIFRDHGYATFHTSSVMFSGKNTNLHQGVEVMHERESIDDLGDYHSKTSREFVDRLLPWLDDHAEQPFFVLLHVFDPHSPFRPMDPHDFRWIDHDAVARHETDLEKIDDVIEIFHELPNAEHLVEAGIDAERFLAAEKAWYDGSIRAMDFEIARLLERLDALGLRDDTLIAFVSDHGEEFLEHGNHWHGHTTYGELVNVPMVINWPGVVPAGLVIDETTQSIDLMPTLLDLARLPIPPEAQGDSLLPLMAAQGDPAQADWDRSVVFTERKQAPGEDIEGAADSFAAISDGWKLVWNVVVRDDRPEFELFDHTADPLNLVNLADAHPERVADLLGEIERWRAMAEAAKIESGPDQVDLSPEELEQLRALGYAN